MQFFTNRGKQQQQQGANIALKIQVIVVGAEVISLTFAFLQYLHIKKVGLSFPSRFIGNLSETRGVVSVCWGY